MKAIAPQDNATPIWGRLTYSEIEILGHALGVNIYHAKVSRRKLDKKLPSVFYRNYFCASDSHDDAPILEKLVSHGLMQKGEPLKRLGGSRYWVVNSEGQQAFRLAFDALINKTHGKRHNT